MAINCIGNFCAGAGPKLQPYYTDFYQILLSNLCGVDPDSLQTVSAPRLDFSDSAIRKIASSALRALHFVVSQDKTLVTEPICDIIQIVHSFIFMSVSVQAYNAADLKSPADERTQRRSRLQPQQPPYLHYPWRRPPVPISSDSEQSDTSDAFLGNPRRQRDDAKIRINALLCLMSIAKTNPRTLYPQLSKFIPDTFALFYQNNSNKGQLSPVFKSDNQPMSLFTILCYDPAPTVRMAACNSMTAILENARTYFSVASESANAKSSFTSLSERTASILRDIHTAIMQVMTKEDNDAVLGHIMKVTCALVSSTPYSRLVSGYLSKLYVAVMEQWQRAQPTTKEMILQVICAILDTHNDQDAVQETFTKPVGDVPPLVDLLLICQEHDAFEVRAMAWRALGAFAKARFTVIQ
ncbi:hypothetical protein BCR43DRAFT_305180 [Syncephalastrum racemosum]|uniref:DUF4042 domain-containing protein n=1 Tax=Syncephalastrum racemosum TaxID=13706 RepID=A0A1X2HA67_SYNRA|nr:hypothetical protein BCR43DRAFT_305180 [Syncephalastrum racemosum]